MTVPADTAEQLALLKRTVRAKRPRPATVFATERPVARVAVDVPLAHLDRPFDYQVPAAMADQAVPGCRVKVRFSGRDVDGYLLERLDLSHHAGALAPLRRVVSAESVLAPAVATLARAVADRYAGTFSDVVRLAVPPRHARVETESSRPSNASLHVPTDSLQAMLAGGPGGPALIRHLHSGESPRAVWTVPPGDSWPRGLAAAVAATRASRRGSIVCLPDARDVARVDAALTDVLGVGAHCVLTADLGPAARYRAFLTALRSEAPIVIGTRAAAFAPVAHLGLVAMWDDGDDLFAEPRAPYPHAREVLMLRAHLEHTAVLLGSTARSVASQLLVDSGWAVPLEASRERVRAATPQVNVAGESDTDLERDAAGGATRMPRRVFEVVRGALRNGPVLVHIPRYGYQPALACANCRRRARCATCAGPIERRSSDGPALCRWCNAPDVSWSCPECGGQRLRAPVVGSLRSAQEWGLAFPAIPIVFSGRDAVVGSVGPDPAIVVATPGAEPSAQGSYAAGVLLDTWLALARPEVAAAEEALRRWLNAAALVRPADQGGRVVVVGEPSAPVVQALVRWDPAGFAARELADRVSARLPPAARLATLTAAPGILADALSQLRLPAAADVLGPVEAAPGTARAVVRVPRTRGPQLTRALQQMQAGRSSRKLPVVRVQVDPDELT